MVAGSEPGFTGFGAGGLVRSWEEFLAGARAPAFGLINPMTISGLSPFPFLLVVSLLLLFVTLLFFFLSVLFFIFSLLSLFVSVLLLFRKVISSRPGMSKSFSIKVFAQWDWIGARPCGLLIVAGGKFLFVFFADDLGDTPPGYHCPGQSTAGLYPMTHHIKIR